MADMVRAIAGGPKVLLLDEPSSGVAAADRPKIHDLITAYQRDTGATVLLVDHDVDFVAGLCPQLVVLSGGRVVATGRTQAVLNTAAVIETFIGVPEDTADAQ
jgi:ABC-type branched-subunit amino acid transport system ATPase component